jgi:hypothetical protein
MLAATRRVRLTAPFFVFPPVATSTTILPLRLNIAIYFSFGNGPFRLLFPGRPGFVGVPMSPSVRACLIHLDAVGRDEIAHSCTALVGASPAWSALM